MRPLRCLFGRHVWLKVGPEHPCWATGCYGTYKFCPHSVRVCALCGKAEAWGSHGKIAFVPPLCDRQVVIMLAERVKLCPLR